jgi:Ca2+:H+ antiporter
MDMLQRKPSKCGNVDGGEQQDKLERGEGNNPTPNVTRRIQPDGESGRNWFNPWHFMRICWYSSSHVSMCTNLLWPFTIAAMVLYFRYLEQHPLWVFITSYIGMVPPANTLGFASQELARKIPRVAGVILETTFGSIVEIILFMVLVTGRSGHAPVIKAAVLGSILANLLLCLGTLSVNGLCVSDVDLCTRNVLLRRWNLPSTANLPSRY